MMLRHFINTPWKAWFEAKMYLTRPLARMYLYICGVKLGKHAKFYGLPQILKHHGSHVHIGDNFENRNWWSSNPLGINHPTIICTWSDQAQIIIGNDVGISGGTLCASSSIKIGDGTLIGANCTIIDTDFHPIKSQNRRYDKNNIKSAQISIGKNVFVGTNTTILKGVIIPDNMVIPAGSIIYSTHPLTKR